MRTFQCPQCNSYSLKITASIDLPYDHKWDDITLQTVKCAGCGFTGLATYLESRRGALDSETWYHDGYHVSKEVVGKVTKYIKNCPKPRDKRCGCASHKALGMKDEAFRWVFISNLSDARPFPMT
ncbi:MAG: hypothetical protein MUO76_04885 [Anaerolineaceae bacterium]|nr:hypothetical protein [Anaerolineaceae bacterium]